MCNVCSPSVLEEKVSKNEHDAVPVLLTGSNKDHEQECSGLLELNLGDLASLDDGKAGTSDFTEEDEPLEETSVVATQCSFLAAFSLNVCLNFPLKKLLIA